MRELAKIKTVTNIRPIEGKDFIVQVNIDGWNVITKKGEFKEGDLCVYVEIDSLMPERPEFEFLKNKKYIIKTMKMAGVRSEGIAFPLSVLPKRVRPSLGKDVTQILGITQYNKEADPKRSLSKEILALMMRHAWFRKLFKKLFAKKKVEAFFPKWIVKTDETRIQNVPKMLELPVQWTATEKLDGSSSTYALKKTASGFEFMVCSRNQLLYEEDNIWHKIAKEHDLNKQLKVMFEHYKASDSIVLQGEIIGPKVQGNKYALENHAFYVFNLVVDRVSRRFVDREFEAYGLKNVPFVYMGSLQGKTVDDILQQATFKSTLRSDALAEGLVFRSFGDNGEVSLSFKAVSPQFLIRNDE